jgi:hypothetical protein
MPGKVHAEKWRTLWMRYFLEEREGIINRSFDVFNQKKWVQLLEPY